MTQEQKLDTKRQEKMASRISIAIIALAAILGTGFFVHNTIKEDKYNTLIQSAPENTVVLPSGNTLPIDDNLEKTVISMIKSEDYSRKEKKQIIELMALQGVDTTNIVATYNSVVKGKDIKIPEDSTKVDDNNDGINDNYEILEKTPVINFLETNGLVTDEIEVVDRGESGLNMLGGKSARSYKNLYEAEKAFGTRLGLFFYVGSLTNYEMVAAYTVGDEFLQCVYAINQDGTAITEDQDIESSDINTLTVKLSMTKESDELMKVYKEYDLYSIEKLATVDDFNVNFYGDEEKINMITLDMTNGRSYVIHTANGIPIEIARALVYELDDGITYVDDIVYEEPTY